MKTEKKSTYFIIYIYKLVKTQNQLKLYKDGSVLENDQAGAGFIIPDFKTEKSFSTLGR